MKPYDFPLIMSAPMVLALLRQVRGEPGGKTQTRRFETQISRAAERAKAEGSSLRAWVRETFQFLSLGDYEVTRSWPCDIRYAATDSMAHCDKNVRGYAWRPAIHMPRRASRLTLLDVSIRRERLGDISEDDARAEGIAWQNPTQEDLEWYRCYAPERGIDPETEPMTGIWVVPGITLKPPLNQLWGPTAKLAYVALWNHLHGPDAWQRDADKEVMVISFRPVLANIDEIGAEHG